MPGNGIDWEGLTGKPMEDITQDDINTVIVGKLINIEKCTKDIGEVKSFYKIFKIIGPIILTALLAFFAAFMNHIGR